jgi:hypothetical protein
VGTGLTADIPVVSGGSKYTKFTAGTGLIVFTANPPLTVDYLVVAGGGGGGFNDGGGGGAGGYRTAAGFSATTGTPYTVTVGGGGNGSGVTATLGHKGRPRCLVL